MLRNRSRSLRHDADTRNERLRCDTVEGVRGIEPSHPTCKAGHSHDGQLVKYLVKRYLDWPEMSGKDARALSGAKSSFKSQFEQLLVDHE